MLELRSHMHRTYLRAVFFFQIISTTPQTKKKMLETRKMTVYAVCMCYCRCYCIIVRETAKRIRSLIWYGSESLSFFFCAESRIIIVWVYIYTHTHTAHPPTFYSWPKKSSTPIIFFFYLGDATFGRKKRRVSCVCVQIGEIEREREKERRKKTS